MHCTTCNDTGHELDPFENDGATIACGHCGDQHVTQPVRIVGTSQRLCPYCGAEAESTNQGGAISRKDLAAVRRILGNLADSSTGQEGHARTFDLGYRAGIQAALNTLKSYER